jgi:hypothetical protein
LGVGARGANSEVEADGAKYEVDANAMYEYEYETSNRSPENPDHKQLVRPAAWTLYILILPYS